jgi:anaerobic ribonucleoside-triphosphate reductase activating protein
VALSNPALSSPWRVHSVLPRSLANGPGARFTVWSQGCSLACSGCFNPDTHAADPGRDRTVGDLVAEALRQRPHIEGVTLTGGEPLEQPAAVAAFCAAVRAHDLGIIILTGFTQAEIEAAPDRAAAVADADLVVAGRYNARLRVGTGLRGSANKTYWARTGRYAPAELAAVPEVEVVIGLDGMVTTTGMAALGREFG